MTLLRTVARPMLASMFIYGGATALKDPGPRAAKAQPTADLIKKYGGDPDEFLTPTPEMSTARQGVDHPDDWAAPESGS